MPGTVIASRDDERDMTFVADTVAGFLAAATAPAVEGETINLGTGTAHSIGAFATRILQLMAVAKPIRQDPRRIRPAGSEVLKLVADAGKAKRLLGWEARTPLDEGLRAAIGFVAEHRELYKPHLYAI